jgi:hypothetical protein
MASVECVRGHARRLECPRPRRGTSTSGVGQALEVRGNPGGLESRLLPIALLKPLAIKLNEDATTCLLQLPATVGAGWVYFLPHCQHGLNCRRKISISREHICGVEFIFSGHLNHVYCQFHIDCLLNKYRCLVMPTGNLHQVLIDVDVKPSGEPGQVCSQFSRCVIPDRTSFQSAQVH